MTSHRHYGSAINVEVQTTYSYRNDPNNIYDQLSDVLGFDLITTRDLESYVEKDVEKTLDYAVEIAQDFVDSQHPVPGNSGKYEGTHRLKENIRKQMYTSSGGSGGRLVADAKDHRGRPYAGHIEYGYTDRGGNPRGPWPFLRPAMRLAVSATRANFADTVARGILNLGDMHLTIGARDARTNIMSVFGTTSNAMSEFKQSYQRYETIYNGAGQGRWDEAYNGIGFSSGVDWGYSSYGYNWDSGEL